MKVEKLVIQCRTLVPILGLASGNKAIHEEFISSKAPKTEDAVQESAAIPVSEQIEKAMTVFPRNEKGLFFWDYQMRGAFKGLIEILIELGDCKISKWSYKKAVDNFLYITPRIIYLQRPDGGYCQPSDVTKNERPLRATTMQGDRIALASSEQLDAGTNWTFELTLLTGSNPKTKLAIIDRELIEKCLALTPFHGFGQWRGGGWGRAESTILTPAKAGKRPETEATSADTDMTGGETDTKCAESA